MQLGVALFAKRFAKTTQAEAKKHEKVRFLVAEEILEPTNFVAAFSTTEKHFQRDASSPSWW